MSNSGAKRLKWNSHVQSLASKLSEVSFVIKSLKEILSTNMIRNIYFTKFQSFYGLVYYAGGHWGELNVRIIRIQK
jgi:hypothetical protein